MNKTDFTQDNDNSEINRSSQKGSALVIAILILALVSVFVALALSRSATEAAAVGNETTEGRTFYAAQGSLEMMTRNFNKVFEEKINPSDTDLNKIKTGTVPGLGAPDYTFNQELDKVSDSVTVTVPGGVFAGLYSIRDNWRLRTTTTSKTGVQVQLTRNFLNNRVPIFQFGIFYDDDLELYRPPLFSFGGRVHTNGNFFLSPGDDGVYFNSRVTVVGQIITQSWRNGYTGDSTKDKTYIKNASLANQQLLPDKSSALNTTAGAADNIFATKPDMPPTKLNTNWTSDSAKFDGNLLTTGAGKELKLPVKISAKAELIEIIKRGKKVADSNGGDLYKDSSNNLAPVTAQEPAILNSDRFANKPGIRISLSDSKAKLPGCASGSGTNPVSGDCGIRLDGDVGGAGDIPSIGSLALRVRGYKPKSMKKSSVNTFSYTPTRINGERLYSGREVWIKVETVDYSSTSGVIANKDITQDFLSLGMTEQIPQIVTAINYDQNPPDNRTDLLSRNLNKNTAQTATDGNDSRSIIKIQRFAIPGSAIPGTTNSSQSAPITKWLYPYGGYNFVVRYLGLASEIDLGCVATCTNVNDNPTSGSENLAHLQRVNYSGLTYAAIVPFPIEMFDTREGTFYDDSNRYDTSKVTKNGVMSMIDIDVANLRRFLRGDYNGLFPTDTPFAVSNGNIGLNNTDIPNNNGWVFYVSDRRGDADFDGEYDMEDIYGDGKYGSGIYYGSDGIFQAGEDANGNGVLDTNFGNEAPNKYDDVSTPDYAAITDHKFYRRGVRLINATVIPGIYDSSNSANTKGFTVASENGVYVLGNYNATGISLITSTGNTPYDKYLPFDTALHIPASIAADSVTILSNNWADSKSFISPYNQMGRLATDTTIRFGMISGDTISSKISSPNQGGISPNLNGGVHNFKRYLEHWTNQTDNNYDKKLNYAGSLINLFNSRNNNGAFKCCGTTYDPPIRNWVFDSTFADPTRLPPGTPFFQYVQITGFQRTNE